MSTRWIEDLRTRTVERYRRLLERDPGLQGTAPSPAAQQRLAAEGLSSLGCLALACELYADRPCFGEGAFAVEDGTTRARPGFRLVTYRELWGRIQALATGFRRLGVCEPGAMVGISGFPSVDWVVADLACLHVGAVSIPLPTIATVDELAQIVQNARVASVACSLEQLETVAGTLSPSGSVRSIVVMDVREHDRAQADALALARQRIEEQGVAVSVRAMAEVERAGAQGTPIAPAEPDADALRTIVYTSGSTGSPKGAMFPERIWARYWKSPWFNELPDVPWVSVDYVPLNHMAGRGSIIRSLVAGGLTSFVRSSDLSTLFDDIRMARPTTLLLVPRVANMVHQHYQAEVARRAAQGRAAEDEVMEEMRRSFLGDRLLYLSTGSAPTAPEVSSFLARCFDVPVVDGYGSTEAGAVAIDGRIAQDNVTEHTLVDAPELGYTRTDRPYPRGELLVKTVRMVPGYYRNAEATRELFDDRGYLRTGDIVEQRAPDEIAWIDRRKNILKLAQGEFVSISRLEEIYATGSPHIRQVFLYGSGLWSYVLAVVVPRDTSDKALLRSEMNRIAAREGLRGYEIPRDFLVETEPFTRASGLLTESSKPARPKLRARYGERLEQLHADIERRQLEELRALERQRGRPTAETIARVFAVTLGLPESEVRSSEQSFLELGGDSLGAVQLVARIHDLCGVDLPVGLVLDPTSSVRALVRAVEERLAGKGPSAGVRFADVHGRGAESIRAEDLRVERFVPSRELAAAGGEPLSGPPVVVVTGANGFLGRFLVLELLGRVAPAKGKVVAAVRAPGGAAARERLAASYDGPDPRLAARFAELADEGRLEVVAADLMRPRLGLTEERWDRLGAEATAIVHNGALVNHAFSYAQLFEPNILGTAEMMRLALRRRAPIGFVSTIGVTAGLDRTDPVREDEDAASLWRRRPVDSGYAVGYSTSKWADELLLRDLEAGARVPVSVFRCSMIMPPRGFAGQVNAGDFLTRLLESVVVTGLAPRSFYAPGVQRPHFDGLPVDVVARAIAAASLATTSGYATYHVVDAHWDDPVSLDSFVDWIEQAGYPVARIEDHAAWVRAFRAHLEALDPAAQQHSALPIMRQWERPIERDLLFDNRRLRERLGSLGEPADLPRIDQATIRRYLEDMIATGLVEPPPTGEEMVSRPPGRRPRPGV